MRSIRPIHPIRPAYLTLALTPGGTLNLQAGEEADGIDADAAWRLEKNFQQGQGLFHLGGGEERTKLPPVLAYWRDFSHHFMRAVSALPVLPGKGQPVQVALTEEEIAHWLSAAPPMPGLDFLNEAALRGL